MRGFWMAFGAVAGCLLAPPAVAQKPDEAEPPKPNASQQGVAPPGMRRITIGNNRESVQALLSVGSQAANDGDLPRAEAAYGRAIEIGERVLGLEDPDTLTAYNNMGYLMHRMGRFDEAERYLERAVETRTRVLGIEDEGTLSAMSNLATLYSSVGRHTEAIPILRQVVEIRTRQNGADDPSTILTLNNLAFSYSRAGRVAEAEPIYLQVMEASERTVGWDHRNTIVSADNLAILYTRQNRYPEALALTERVVEAAERVFGPNHQTTLTAINNLATIYSAIGRDEDAIPYFQRALAGAERVHGREHPRTMITLDNYASSLMDLGRFAEAEPLRLRVLETYERTLGDNHRDTLITLNNLAVMYDRQGRDAEAERYYVRALEGSRRLLGEAHPTTMSTATDLAILRLNAGQPTAIEPARLLLDGMRERRAGIVFDQFGEAEFERQQTADGSRYSLFADAAWVAPNRASLRDEAFVALQDSITGTTNRALVQSAIRRFADERGAGLGALVRQREDLGERWAANNEYYALTLAEGGAEGEAMRQRALAERAEIDAGMAAIDQRLQNEFPDYFALVRPEGLDVRAAQRILSDDEAILLTVPTRRGTHVMAITRDSAEWAQSEWTAPRIGRAVQRLRWDVGASTDIGDETTGEWAAEDGANPGEAIGFHRTTAHELYQQLVAPVADTLAGKRHVFVAAAGSLSGIPFSILVTEPPQGADNDADALRSTRWFADEHALTHIASIQSLALLRRTASEGADANPADRFAGFGDPVLDGTAQTRGLNRGATALSAADIFERSGDTRSGVANVRALRNLARLPGTARELENMRVALGAPASSLRLAEAATEPAVRTADLSNARIIAFATHGLTANEATDVVEPGLVLTPPQRASEEDDGYLAASEVAALRLAADWVILSACNTAAGDGSEGAAGLSGLARAFFYAGARNLLASHWPVNDEVAARITVRTIELRQENPVLTRAEAFQRAMREIREDAAQDTAEASWAHPAFWAPFTLVGDGAR